jgi:hypothetical protein
MGSHREDMRSERPAGALGGDIAAHVEAIVRAAEREALAAGHAIEDRRRSAEEEVRRYLAASRLHVDAEAAARAARLESLSSAARRLADELSDAADALNRELRRSDDELRDALPRAPWPAAPGEAPVAPPQRDEPVPSPPPSVAPEPPQPTWARTAAKTTTPPRHDTNGAAAPALAPEPHRTPPAAAPPANGELPNAARLVAIEMAVGGASRADVEQHLVARFAVGDPTPLLDDVFGAESHAGSRLAWGEP